MFKYIFCIDYIATYYVINKNFLCIKEKEIDFHLTNITYIYCSEINQLQGRKRIFMSWVMLFLVQHLDEFVIE